MESLGWLVLLVVLVAIEAATMGLFTIWFAGGALVAFLVSLFEVSLMVQLVVFVVVSFILLYFTRPVLLRHINTKRVKTNVDSIIGMEAKVMEKIDNYNATGMAVLNGQEWTARSEKDEEVIPAGERVIVKEVKGVKLIVAPIREVKSIELDVGTAQDETEQN